MPISNWDKVGDYRLTYTYRIDDYEYDCKVFSRVLKDATLWQIKEVCESNFAHGLRLHDDVPMTFIAPGRILEIEVMLIDDANTQR